MYNIILGTCTPTDQNKLLLPLLQLTIGEYFDIEMSEMFHLLNITYICLSLYWIDLGGFMKWRFSNLKINSIAKVKKFHIYIIAQKHLQSKGDANNLSTSRGCDVRGGYIFLTDKTLLMRFCDIPKKNKRSSHTNFEFFTCKSKNLCGRYP